MQEKCSQIREEIRKFQLDKCDEVEVILQQMREKREELDQTRAESEYFLNNHPVVAVVNQREERLKEITGLLSMPLHSWNPRVLNLQGIIIVTEA